MMRCILALLASAAWFDTAAAAQDFHMQRPVEPPEAAAEIIGGHKAIVAEWPATFVFGSPDGKHCTATAIGPRVLLTAAHCVADGASGTMGANKVPVTCWRHDWYSGSAAYDLAFCASNTPIQLAVGEPFESVDFNTAPARERLILLGYGCTAIGGTAGVLYQGASWVDTIAAPRTPFFETVGGASVCSGDSGGGSFRPGQASARRIVGIASRALDGGRSRFTLLADPEVRNFIARWRRDHVGEGVKICGLDETPLSCHG